MTHFERLGVPARFDLDPGDLERAFLAASRAVHPDHHAGGHNDAAAVNAAYHALRDPLRRAEYVLAERGGPAVGQGPPQDPAFLMEVMDLRERLETDQTTVVAELSDRLSRLSNDLANRFAASDLPNVRRLLDTGRTLTSLLREAEAD